MREVTGLARSSLVTRTLRLGLAACFIGHGAFGLLQKPEWVRYFALFGIPDEIAFQLMPLVGTVDILVGILALAAPTRALFAYAAVWCLMTAALRPLAGQGIAEMLERAGNYGVPIALLLVAGRGAWLKRLSLAEPSSSDRIRVFRACQLSSAALLIGHGLLALGGKPLLQQHLTAAGFAADHTVVVGAIDLGAAAAVLLVPHSLTFGAVAVWKLLTESLFLVAGAPIFEFIERGGSYVAPLVAMMLSRRVAVPRLVLRHAFPLRAPMVLVASLLATASAFASPGKASAQVAAPPAYSPAVLQELRMGGLVVACRHAITSHAREDRMPVNFDDPTTQRVLSPEGEQQARALGEDLRTLGIEFGEILASPFQRTRLSAELMFQRVAIDTTLSSTARGREAQLLALVTTPPADGRNRLLMIHQGLLYRVFTSIRQGTIGEGSCVVAKPLGERFELLALVRPEDWTP